MSRRKFQYFSYSSRERGLPTLLRIHKKSDLEKNVEKKEFFLSYPFSMRRLISDDESQRWRLSYLREEKKSNCRSFGKLYN